MKKHLLTLAALSLIGMGSATAQDVFIETMSSNPDIELIQDAKFDPAYGNIGQCSNFTIVGLGEVDFGDGTRFKAAAAEFANGWGSYEEVKYVVLHAGPSYDESVVIDSIPVIRTFGYHCFERFAANFKLDEGVAMPTGKQGLWFTFGVGSGNVRSITLMEDAIPEGCEGMQLWPNEEDGYYDNALLIDGSELIGHNWPATLGDDCDPDDPNYLYRNCHYDEAAGSWHNIETGFTARTAEMVDFGNGDYSQLVAFIGHDGERYQEYTEFYIDDPDVPSNLICRIWTGFNLGEWDSYTPAPKTIKTVTGKHYLFVKWGLNTNLQKIELVKGNVWYESPDCRIVYENLQPSENAVLYQTIGQGQQGGDPAYGEMEWEVLVAGPSSAHGEGQNIGYTANGVVVAYYDIDFKGGEYQSVIINHSASQTYLGEIEEANFSLYVDLEDIDWSIITTVDELAEALSDYEPFAIVRAQGTGDWGKKMSTGANFLKTVEGVHNIYVVYNLVKDGANIYGLYLDPQAIDTRIATLSDAAMDIQSEGRQITVTSSRAAVATLYDMGGRRLGSATLTDGDTATMGGLEAGICILKLTDGQGQTLTRKVIVK